MKLTPSYRKVQKNRFTKNIQLWVSIPLLFLFIFTEISAHANTIDSQRKDYLAAKKAFELKQYKKFGKIANTLKDYPLYPYLRYNY